MYHHAPAGYDCPFCKIASGESDEYTTPESVVYHDDGATAFISPTFWANNGGHVLVIPNRHFENIYELPDDVAAQLNHAIREIALALREAYPCEGVSTRQHNEPAGYQEVWHYHVHIFPRYAGDDLYGTQRHWVTSEERFPYAKLRDYFAQRNLTDVRQSEA